MAKQLNVDVNLNTAKASAQLKSLQEQLNAAINGATTKGSLTKEIVQATEAASKLKAILNSSMNNAGNLDLSKFSQNLKASGTNITTYAKQLNNLGAQGQQAFASMAKQITSAQAPMRQVGALSNQLLTSLKNTARWQLSSAVLHGVINAFHNAFSYARGLNESLNSIRIVTGQSADQMDRFARSANASAKALSASTLDYTDAALIYYQQGIRDEKEIKARTDATIKMANVTKTSAQQVSEQMTAIWNNFADGSSNLEYFADVITALGANTASSSAEIAKGLEKFAAVADTVGLSYEYATSALATIVATTRQSEDIVGTALKTLFARIQDLELGKTLEDGTTLGKYSKALDAVGVSIKDQNGELRNMDNILDDMGNKWKTLSKDQQVALAQTVAGQRQYTQLVALMDNWDFMQSNLQIAYGSEGTLQKQQEIYAESWDAARTRVRASWQGILDDLVDDKFFINFNNGLSTALNGLGKFVHAIGGMRGTLALVSAALMKMFSTQFTGSIDRGIASIKRITGIAAKETEAVKMQTVRAMESITPAKDSPKSMLLQTQYLKDSVILSNQYNSKLQEMARLGIAVSDVDKEHMSVLQQMVELYGSLSVGAQKEAEAASDALLAAQQRLAVEEEQKAIRASLGAGQSQQQAFKTGKQVRAEVSKTLDAETQRLLYAFRGQEGFAALKQGWTPSRDQFLGMRSLVKGTITDLNTPFKTLNQMTFFKDGQQIPLNAALQYIASEQIKGLKAADINGNQIPLKNWRSIAQQANQNQAALIEARQYDRYLSAMQRKSRAEALQDAGQKLTPIQRADIAAGKYAISQLTGKGANVLANARVDNLTSWGRVLFAENPEQYEKIMQAARVQAQAEGKASIHGQAYSQAQIKYADALTKLNDPKNGVQLSKNVSQAAMGVANLSIGVNSLVSGFKALNDESLSFGEKLLQTSMSFGMGISMLTMGITSITSSLPKLVTGFEALHTVLVGGQGLRAGLAGLEIVQSLKSALPLLLSIAGVVASIAVLVKIFKSVKEDIHAASIEGKLEAAVEEGNQLTSALEEAKNAAEGLKSAFDSYHSVADTLHNCTTGTKEWTEALRANNNEVLSLMAQYPELAKIQGAIQKNADGSLSISQEAEDQMNKMAANRVDTLSWAKLANTELQQDLQSQIDINEKSREMLELQKEGQNATPFKGTVKEFEIEHTSDFDTDMRKGFRYAIGSDESALDAYQRAQLRDTQGAGALREMSANQKANQLLLENWEELQALSGESLTNALNQVMSEGGLKISSDDLAKYSAAVESSTYRGEITKLYNQQKAQQEAFETQQIGLVASKLASEGVLENDSKTRALVSSIFGKQLDERTQAAVAADKEAYNRGGEERKALAEAYVKAMGGDINSISWKGNEFSYLDSAGQKIEGITSSMVSSVTGAASALEELAGAATAAADAMAAIPRTEGGDAVRDFLTNGNLTKTSTKGLKALLGDQLGAERLAPTLLAESLISSLGGFDNMEAIASALGQTSEEFLADFSKSVAEENAWYRSDNRKNAIAQLNGSTGAELDRLEAYSRSELEARQRYEDSKINRGAVKTLEELEVAAQAAGEAHEYLNRTWKDGAHLSGEQLAGLKNIISDSEQYALVIDESTGKIKDASLLNDMLSKSVKDVGVEAARAQVPIYEQMNDLYSELANMDYSDIDRSKEHQAGILQEIELLEKEISKYQELALAQSGAAQAYAKIAEGAEWDTARDYTDELEGAVKSIYSHMEDNNWKTLEWGSHEVKAAMEALLPENVLHPDANTPSWMTPQQYIEFIYGNGKKSGRYMSNGEVTYENAQNFIKDAIGGSGLGTGFANSINLETGEIDFKEALGEPGMYDTVSLADAARSMHMTEAAFLSMITAMDKYNQSGTTFLSQFALEGSEFATQMQAQAQNVEDAAKKMQEALDSGDPDKIKAASEEQTKQLRAQAEFRKQAIDDALKYQSLVEERDALLEDPTVTADDSRLQELNTQIAALEADGIELKVELVTDETSIENIKSKVQSAFEGNEFNVDALSVDDWTQIISQIENLDNPFEGWEKSGLNKILTDTEKLPKNLQDALGKLDKDSSWVKDLNNGIKEALQGDGENQVGFEIDQESIDAMSKAIDEVCEKERTINAKLPDEVTDYLDNSDSFGKSGKYGGSHNPAHEGSTTSKSKPKVEQPTSTPASKVNVDTGEAEAKLTILKTLIAQIPPNIPLTVTTNSAVVSAELTTISSLAASISGIAPQLTISTNSNIIDAKLNRTKTFALALNRVKPKITIQTNAGSIMNIVSRLQSALNNLKSPPPINIDVNIRVNGSMPKGTSPAFGTAQAFGTAAANGKWGTGKGPIAALVGELGPELVVDPSNGKFYTVGDTGAEFTMLPKNAIVFNHRQTEQLLKYRKINSRGQALVDGNAFAAGVAAATGTAAAAGAGADLTYEQQLLTIIRDETDAYRNLETAVKKLNHTYEFIARNNDRLWGRNVLVNMEQSINALNKVYEKQRKIQGLRTRDYEASIARFSSNELQYTKKVAHPSSTAEEPKWNTELVSFSDFNAVKFLQNLGYLKDNPFTMDANGHYTDFDAVAFEEANANYMRAYEKKYNAAIKAATTEADKVAAENELANAQAIFEANKKLISESDTKLDEMIQSINNAQDSLEEMHDLAAEKIQKRLEMKVALDDGELKIIDSRMKSMGDSIYKMAESMTMLWNGDPRSANDKYSQIVSKALAYEQEYDEALQGLAIAQKDFYDPHAITGEKFIEIAEEARDGMLEQIDALLELKEAYAEYYGNVLSKATEELEKYTNQMEHQASVLEHLKNLMDLTGRKYDYKGQETIIRGQLEMAKDAYEVAKHWEMTTKENMEAAQKSYEELLLTDALGAENYKNEVLDKAVEYFNEAEEKMLASAEDYLQNYENLWQNTLDAVRDKWDKLATDGMGWDALLDSMDRAKSIQDEYLTTTNKLYETNTLLRKVNKDINSTDSIISKEKLNDFAKMVEARQKDNQLTQSGMEILKAKYELLQAELALEEMKDAKDTVRLQRDSEGNYGYVYTADQEKMENAEQNFADKQNDLYNLVLGYSNDYREKYIQSLKEYEDKVMAIYENDALTEEERQRQLNELKQQYSDLWHAYDLTLQEAGLELNRVAAEGISEAWATQYDDRIAKQSEFLDASSEAEATLQDIMKEITEAHKDMTDDAELGLSDVEKKTKDVTTANHNLAEKLNTEVIPKVDTAIDRAEVLTKQWESQATMVDKLIEKYHKLAEAMQAAMGEQAGMLGNTGGDISDKIWQHYYDTGEFSDTLLKERSNAASSMTKEGGYYWNNAEMKTFMEAYKKDSGGYNSWSDLAYDVIYNNHVNTGAGGSLHDTLEEMAKDTRRKKYNVEELASGGYTGEWGPEGKLAMLHEKELVLNATDTANMLDTIEALREMTRSMNLRSMISGMVDMIASPAFLNSQNNTLQQEVHITAEFPNATNHNEIEQAFTNLVNRASQYANRSNWKNSTDTLVEGSVFD